MIRVLFAFGTRPEAIKLAPLITHLQTLPATFDVRVCLTSQHMELLRHVTDFFGIREDVDLEVMTRDQNLEYITSAVVTRMRDVLLEFRPDVLLVQGDTTTVFASALAAFYHKTAVGHVEAGLRSYNKYSPFPEEMNRRLASSLTDFHFAPTRRAAENLIREGIPAADVFMTGNTVIDALFLCRRMLDGLPVDDRRRILLDTGIPEESCDRLLGEGDIRLILVTAHRRESFGEPFLDMCRAMLDIVTVNRDVELVYPVHPNPNVRRAVDEVLRGHPRIHLIAPVRYEQLVDLMTRSHLILTDSGGIQEEGPSLSKPVLVMRDVTERPEGIDAGVARLVGTDRARIAGEVQRLLDDPSAYRQMTGKENPYGDGKASERIAAILLERLGEGSYTTTEQSS